MATRRAAQACAITRHSDTVQESLPERSAVAVEFVAVFAEAAKKRHAEGVRRGAEVANSRHNRSGEKMPQSADGERGPPATDEAAELFGVSGRPVRDAQYVKNNDPDTFERVKAGDVAVSRAGMPVKRPRMPRRLPYGRRVGYWAGWSLWRRERTMCAGRSLPAENWPVKPINVPIW